MKKKILVAVLALIMVTVMGVSLFSPKPLKEFPVPLGDYQVGMTMIDTQYVTEDGNEKIVPSRIFYPSENNMGNETMPYATREENENMRELSYGLFGKNINDTKTHYYEGIPISDSEANYPIIFFSHGGGGYSLQNTTLCSDLASMGYVVIAPSHPDSSDNYYLSDGTLVSANEQFDVDLDEVLDFMLPLLKEYGMYDSNYIASDEISKEFLDKYHEFSPKLDVYGVYGREDIEHIILHLEELNDDTDFLLSGKLNTQKIGTTGHSLGSGIATQALHDIEGITCGIGMDGMDFVDDHRMDVAKPYMFIGSGPAWNTSRHFYYDNSDDSYAVVLMDAQHWGYSDYLYAQNFITGFSGFKLGKRDMYEFRRSVSELHIRFFDKYLKDKDIDIGNHEIENLIYHESVK